MEHLDSKRQSRRARPAKMGFSIGQYVRIARRGRAKIAMQIMPGIWGVDFLDLDGFGYVFEAEMTA